MNKQMIVAAAAALLFGAGAPAAAYAADKSNAKTPDNFAYDIKNGKPVPKSKRVTAADGSWTEEVKQGNCVVTRTGRSGEVREVRKCS
jgi:hypothetical protein